MNDTTAIVRRLVEAYRQRLRIEATPGQGPADPDQAYAVQRLVWQAMAGDRPPVAWKVAASSRDAEPIAAPVFPDRLADSPGCLARARFVGIGVEAEIALRFGQDLPPRPTPYSRAEILAAIGSAHVAMELVDSRLADPEVAGPYWRLADNLLNGALILGDALPHWRTQDWRDLTVRITADDVVLSETVGRQPLEDLFHCLPWWLAHAGGARKGDIVTTGAWSGMHPAGNAIALSATFNGLGKVEACIR